MTAPGDEFRCELHMHTSFSDGYRTPDYMLGAAVAKKLAVVAITDHDNARGARRAAEVAPHMGLRLIPAIEFTARWEGICGPGTVQDVDILGYGIDLEHPALRARESAALEDVFDRVALCCSLLTDSGYAVRFREVQGLNAPYPGLRQLRDLLVIKGYCESEPIAGRLLDAHWALVRPCAFTVADQIEAIHAAGGVAVLAHPGLYPCGTSWIAAEQLAALVERGLDGLEVYHRSMNSAARVYFAGLAARFGLVQTGGSDEHGWSPGLDFMGREPVTAAMVDALLARIGRGGR